VIPPVPSPAKLPIPLLPGVAHAGLVDVVVAEVMGETGGTAGANELGATSPAIGNRPGAGTAGAELMPRLPISSDPNGIPVRAAPPGVVGEVDVGVEDAARLLEPEPHAPEIPDVSIIPEDVDVPGVAIVSGVAVPVVTGLPVVAAVAGPAVPAAVPPPS
jgi:hypothetical protein